MPGDRAHHTDAWHSCVEQVMAKGHDESEASAICSVSLQKAGEPIFEAAMRHLHLRGATGAVRTATHDDREHLVVPVVALMEGVIHAVNAETPEYVSEATLRKAASTWNGRPVMLGHPTKNGRQCSANAPEIQASHGIGTVFNARVEGKKLLCEAWIDVAKAKKLHPTMLARLLENQPEEVSVGAFVVTDGARGEHGGKPYLASWVETTGDHLAFLPGGRGACSLEMGCGAHRAASHVVTSEGLEVPVSKITALKTRILAFFDAPEQTVSEAEALAEELRAAAGKRNSAADQDMIQTVHDHATALGAECDTQNVRWMAKKKDCAACEGTGQLTTDGTQADCPSCDGTGHMKAAEAACGCQGEASMERKALIESLSKHAHNPTKNPKALEALSDDELKSLDAHCAAQATLKAATDKAEAEKKAVDEKAAADLKTAQDKAKTIEEQFAEFKAASGKPLTEDEFLKVAPASIRALVEDKKKTDADRKSALVTQLKTAQSVYNEERLNEMPIAQLEEIAQLAKVETVDYSGRGIAVPRGAASAETFAPPDPYAAGLKAMQSKTIN